jgi:hypothetical protein
MAYFYQNYLENEVTNLMKRNKVVKSEQTGEFEPMNSWAFFEFF